MKKTLMVLCLGIISIHAKAIPPYVPPVCKDNGWFELFFSNKDKPKTTKEYRLSSYGHPKAVCVLPDGKHYDTLDLAKKQSNEYKELFKQYSGISPTPEQVEKTKEELRKQGYIVN